MMSNEDFWLCRWQRKSTCRHVPTTSWQARRFAAMDDETRRTHVAELRRLEDAYEKAERRLKHLLDARLPTSDELDEALTLSNVLPILSARMEQLRRTLDQSQTGG